MMPIMLDRIEDTIGFVITRVIVHLIITVVFAAMAVDVESIVLLGINVHISLNQR